MHSYSSINTSRFLSSHQLEEHGKQSWYNHRHYFRKLLFLVHYSSRCYTRSLPIIAISSRWYCHTQSNTIVSSAIATIVPVVLLSVLVFIYTSSASYLETVKNFLNKIENSIPSLKKSRATFCFCFFKRTFFIPSLF